MLKNEISSRGGHAHGVPIPMSSLSSHWLFSCSLKSKLLRSLRTYNTPSKSRFRVSVHHLFSTREASRRHDENILEIRGHVVFNVELA